MLESNISEHMMKNEIRKPPPAQKEKIQFHSCGEHQAIYLLLAHNIFIIHLPTSSVKAARSHPYLTQIHSWNSFTPNTERGTGPLRKFLSIIIIDSIIDSIKLAKIYNSKLQSLAAVIFGLSFYPSKSSSRSCITAFDPWK